MTSLTLYHNPRCSKSRQALKLLEERGCDFHVRRYLDDPLSREELAALAARLDADVAELVRTGDSDWKALQLTAPSTDDYLDALAEHPRLLQRPLLDRGDRAVIGRPPATILALVDAS
ncbi:arsenate reductase (glutaredoxin) [Modicisalibacter radicis]|uniref:arsenate reductase (glutaredoxin) n=1 Tax=Halomonas sp. EAR18 TaxID=2518972 RepID=UPI00109CA85A|nr:arsenate reductase (glutaredoxin) [Halomonas sp. EAR18]